MSLDNIRLNEYEKELSRVSLCIGKSKSMNDALPCYEYLYKIKNKIPKELYAYYYRSLLQMSTRNVPKELRLKMFEDINQEDIMYQDELDAINKFEKYITIYRGTTSNEIKPGLSWSLKKYIAESFINGRKNGILFEATISKNDILLYFCHEEAEEEIIANVTHNYKIIKEF